MATINFFLKKADKKGDCPIMMTYQHRGQKFRYSTRLKTPAQAWNEETQRVRKNYNGSYEMNSILEGYEATLKGIEREALLLRKEYSVEQVRKKFLLQMGEQDERNDFFKVYDLFIDENRPIRSKSTIQTYEATKSKLEDFSKAKGVKISFDAIDQNFYESFLNYMIKELRHLNNTVGKHIKTLKVFLTYAQDHEYTAQIYNLKKFKVFNEEADIIYLSEEELFRIYELPDLPERLSNVRDCFCFACFTGLRFSDVDKLNPSHLKGDFIEIKAEKTKDTLRIPLVGHAKAILSRYEGKNPKRLLPTGITNQKTNEYLKEIGQLAKLNEIVYQEKFNGSTKLRVTKRKWELLTTHTARRTFVTLSLEKGIRAEVVMAMTGHKSYKTFKRYIKITDKVTQAEMDKVWNKPLLRVV